MPDTHQYLLKDAAAALQAHRLQSALAALHGVATMLKEFDIAEELTGIEDSYAMLLNYFAKGTDDPMRMKLYEKFFARTCEILEALKRSSEMTKEKSCFAATERTLQQMLGAGHTPQALAPFTGRDFRTVFDAVMVAPLLTPADEESLSAYLLNGKNDEVLSCLILSALTLSCMRFFDAAKMRILADVVLTDRISLRVRSLVGLVFITATCPDALKHQPDLTARLHLMMDVPGFPEELEMVQQQIFLSLDTKRFDKEIREQLMPQILKHIQKAKREGLLDVLNASEKLMNPEENPEWSEGDQHDFEKSMRGIAEMHARGADIYMSTFKTLKQRFSFFNAAANWFWPFTLNHPDLSPDCRTNSMLRMMLSNAGVCDSDKYSLCMMAGMIPQGQLKEAMNIIPQEFIDNTLNNGNADLQFSPADFRSELRSYVQGFYRFCNLFAHRQDFVNPFTSNLFLPDCEPFAELRQNEAWMLRQVDVVFQDKSYELAQHIYSFIPVEHLNAQHLQKLGFCMENQQNYAGAISLYVSALEKQGNSAWTLRRLAACYRYEEQYAEALEYLRELEKLNPESPDLALLMADCCIRMNNYEAAFNYLFKADYLQPNQPKTIRALAWCSLSTGKYEQAEKYYSKITHSEQQVQKSDFLNAGHTAWLMGNVEEATRRYRQFVSGAAPDYDFLRPDRDLLLRSGLTEAELTLMADAVFNS